MVTIYEYDTRTKALQVTEGFPDGFSLSSHNQYWIDLQGKYDRKHAELVTLEKVLKVHPLTFEDLVEKEHRPKVEEFDEYLFILLHSVTSRKITKKTKVDDITTELNIFFGKNFIVTIHELQSPSIAKVHEIVTKQRTIWERSLVHILYKIVDHMVDEYIPLFERINEEIDRIGEQALVEQTSLLFEDLLSARRQVLFLKRIVTPQQEIFSKLSRSDSRWYEVRHRAYFRDIYDHLSLLSDVTENLRDELENAFNTYTTYNANKLNEVIKTLTLFASIMMPLTLIAGIYGMNFKYMPELSMRFGYPAIMGVMVVVAGALIYYFKRKDWI